MALPEEVLTALEKVGLAALIALYAGDG